VFCGTEGSHREEKAGARRGCRVQDVLVEMAGRGGGCRKEQSGPSQGASGGPASALNRAAVETRE